MCLTFNPFLSATAPASAAQCYSPSLTPYWVFLNSAEISSFFFPFLSFFSFFSFPWANLWSAQALFLVDGKKKKAFLGHESSYCNAHIKNQVKNAFDFTDNVKCSRFGALGEDKAERVPESEKLRSQQLFSFLSAEGMHLTAASSWPPWERNSLITALWAVA